MPILIWQWPLACFQDCTDKKQTELKQPATVGNGYRDFSNGTLPKPGRSDRQMKESKIAKTIFGEKFVEHFVQTREWEWKQHLKQSRIGR